MRKLIEKDKNQVVCMIGILCIHVYQYAHDEEAQFILLKDKDIRQICKYANNIHPLSIQNKKKKVDFSHFDCRYLNLFLQGKGS